MIIVFGIAMAESKEVVIRASCRKCLDGPVMPHSVRTPAVESKMQEMGERRTSAKTGGPNQSAGHPVSYTSPLWLDHIRIPSVIGVCFAQICTGWRQQYCPDWGLLVPRRQAEEGSVSFEAVMTLGPLGPYYPLPPRIERQYRDQKVGDRPGGSPSWTAKLDHGAPARYYAMLHQLA